MKNRNGKTLTIIKGPFLAEAGYTQRCFLCLTNNRFEADSG